MAWVYQQFFPCALSFLMVVDGLWDLGFHLNLTRDTICDTWLFIQSMGRQPCLPGPNSPISHSFPSFLVCIFEISSFSHGALCLQPPSLSLSPSCSLVLHSPTLSCHPPALPPQTAAFFSTDLILTGLVSCCWNHSIASSPLQQGPWGELCPPEKSLNNNPVSSEESWYQMEARSRDWLKVKSKLMKNKTKQNKKTKTNKQKKKQIDGSREDPCGRRQRSLWPESVSIHVCLWCSFHTQCEALSWDQDRILKKRLNWTRC